ncbi:VWA domain-containing protein [Deinococcus maricopensis]|uniref:Magnesium chelatase n=1 Tax=Deinococcus maricopensis (strain DSM 21211 / LMG 22137 / NRRL B-23946 / LB-34) TaxID=709986 RepID=E8U437_DEIML|nr:VWA domain-containing protein [Deinococcus maricopensis]ADV65874.1 Magnesium chelatase [Deinococcus maricopensis DSM 21211]
MSYPFCAIVGQDDLKLALTLLAVTPAIGGVLVQGDKGSAKSTTARALAELLPPTGSGAPAPFVTLPLGATEDRVIGTLDLEKALRGEKALQSGLIRAAHEGVLYIDEVNLLADHLVDVLLDVAAMGVNRVEREGLAEEHAAVFALIGTMNPEEGTLRPQFLDRFGLCVDVGAPGEARARAEIVRRRMRYEADPAGFSAAWADAQAALRAQVRGARARYPEVQVSDALLEAISELCQAYGVRSLRADLVLHRAARALAALDGRREATLEDVKRVAPLVLTHRKRQHPTSPQGGEPDLEQLMEQLQPPERAPDDAAGSAPDDEPAEAHPDPGPPEDEPAPAETTFRARPPAASPVIDVRGLPATHAGRRGTAEEAARGRTVRTRPSPSPSSLALPATLVSAAGRAALDGQAFQVTRADLHERVREGRVGSRVLFVVDASGSMGARARMEAVKGAALALLADAYARRDEVGVITFRGIAAEVALPFTRDVDVARAALDGLPTGGRTPLAHALTLARDVVRRADADGRVLLVLLTDGRGNVPLPGGGDAWAQALDAAAQLQGTPALVLDTEAGVVRAGRAAEIAGALGAECLTLEALSAEGLTLTLRGRTLTRA